MLPLTTKLLGLVKTRLLVIMRAPRFWIALIIFGAMLRVYEVVIFSNPRDRLWSDPWRHWENGKQFLNPGPMGSSNAYLYQLWMFILQNATAENRFAIGIVTSLLSLSLPFVWSLVGAEVLTHRLTRLRFTAIICLMPSLSLNYCYFMSETLLLPLLGLSLYVTLRAIKAQSAWYASLTVICWVLTLLTRTVVLPVALLCIALAFRALPWRSRLAAGLPALLVSTILFTFSAAHSYKHFSTYSPLGHDGKFVLIYFLSDTTEYEIRLNNDYHYLYSSPTFGLPTFYPFSEWRTSRRQGVFSFTFSPEHKGKDIDKVIAGLIRTNFSALPRLVAENIIFLLFSYSWPEAGTESILGEIALWSRWIWAPLIVLSFIGSTRLLLRGQRTFVPMVTVLFILSLFGGQVALMEGRYRKPLEPIVLLSVFYLLEQRKKIAAPAPVK